MSNVVRLSDIVAGFGRSLLDAQRQVDAAQTNVNDAVAHQAGIAPDDLVKMAAANPMRVLSGLRCDECGHSWQQPAANGACPRCHSTDVRCTDQRVSMAKRV